MPCRPAIPEGSWPRQMTAARAAGYCDEHSVEAFLSRVGTDYPAPTVGTGRRGLWLKEVLDEALERRHRTTLRMRTQTHDAADLIVGPGSG